MSTVRLASLVRMNYAKVIKTVNFLLIIFSVFVALSACIAVQLGYYPTWMFFQCFCAMTLFYCAHWQTYVSGKFEKKKNNFLSLVTH